MYVVPVRPPALLCGLEFMAEQKSSKEGGDSNMRESSVCMVCLFGVSVIAVQMISVR